MIGNSILAQYLEDCECIQGDTMTLTYEFFDGDGNPLDLRRAKMYVTFCPYGQYNSPALTKQGIVSSGAPNTCVVNLTKQPVILINEGEDNEREYRRAQGDIIMYPAIYART